jgi:uncharacterized membrane-anchored protein
MRTTAGSSSSDCSPAGGRFSQAGRPRNPPDAVAPAGFEPLTPLGAGFPFAARSPVNRSHTPVVDGRYWLAITLASVFGTNLGDLYAHTSGLGLLPGVAVLVAMALAVFLVEPRDRLNHELYYWVVIIVIRTGATNIADYLAFRLRIPPLPLTVALAALLVILAWMPARAGSPRLANGLPETNGRYWAAMLTAGVFGTVVGDISAHAVGLGTAAIGLTFILALALLVAPKFTWVSVAAAYWLVVAAARTAGTAVGDWLAESKGLKLGLPLSTLLTGLVFVGVLLLWTSRRPAAGIETLRRL